MNLIRTFKYGGITIPPRKLEVEYPVANGLPSLGRDRAPATAFGAPRPGASWRSGTLYGKASSWERLRERAPRTSIRRYPELSKGYGGCPT
ncbi:MAG: hypothetical protein MZU97_12360 [Bacillus subtilis]|nr:hypothetical protein [Bacillus subtilis]